MIEFQWFALGWFSGAVAIWGHFHWHRLIRSRAEWYADRKARGYPVPDDWDDPFWEDKR